VVFDAQNTKKFAMQISGAPKIPFGFFSVPRVMGIFEHTKFQLHLLLTSKTTCHR